MAELLDHDLNAATCSISMGHSTRQWTRQKLSWPSLPSSNRTHAIGGTSTLPARWLYRGGAAAVRGRTANPGHSGRALSPAVPTSAPSTSAHCPIARACSIARRSMARVRHPRPGWPPSPTVAERSRACIAPVSTRPPKASIGSPCRALDHLAGHGGALRSG